MMADKVFKIDQTGKLYRCSPTDNERVGNNESNNDAEAASAKFSGSSRKRDASSRILTEIKGNAHAKRVTDLAVYRTYFNSIGPTHMVFFILGGIAFAFTLKFPGEMIDAR